MGYADWKPVKGAGRLTRYGARIMALVALLGAALAGFTVLGSAPAGAVSPAGSAVSGEAPRQVEAAEIIRRGNPNRMVVALTFDAGADRGYAEMILNTLAEQGVLASFGMTGLWASENRDLIRRMAEEGHEFMNHTWDHRSWTGFSPKTRALTYEERRVQIVRLEEVLGEVVGVNPQPLFRSPYGDVDGSVQQDLASFGYRYNVLWTVDSRGWLKIPADQIVRQCLNNAVPGAIYVMHVGGESLDGPALPRIIAGLRDQGYGFATVSQILE